MLRGLAPALLVCAGCSGSPSPPPPPAPVDPGVAACSRRASHAVPLPIDGERRGSAVAIVRGAGGRYAYVADHDSRAIHVVDLDARKPIGRTLVAGAPRELVVLGDGRVVVTLASSNEVVVLEPGDQPGELDAVCARPLPEEPWGVAASRDDTTIVVASAFGAAVSILDGDTLAARAVVPVSRDPRGVLVDRGGRAWVSHLVGGVVSRIDTGAPQPRAVTIDLGTKKSAPGMTTDEAKAERTGIQGYALASVVTPPLGGGERAPRRLEGLAPPPELPRAPRSQPAEPPLEEAEERIMVPLVSVDPGSPDRPLGGYYGSQAIDGVPKQAPVVRVLDPASGRPLTRTVLATSQTVYARECLLPRAVATRPAAGSILVACLGIDAVVELDARVPDPMRAERRRFDVPPGPSGVAVDERAAVAVVFSQFEGRLTVLDLADDASEPIASIALDHRPTPDIAAIAPGRALFYRTDDLRIANDGLACASCHPDARDDGLSWMTPDGPRQTLMLAGRTHDTAPYGWSGHQGKLEDYISTTVSRLGGIGLDYHASSALARFVEGAPTPSLEGAADVERVRAIFFGAEQGCASCHVGGGGTDGALHVLDPGSKPSAKGFDTPSLRFVAGTAPYFHDGRYATLEALLADRTSHMGQPGALTVADRADLLAFLRSL